MKMNPTKPPATSTHNLQLAVFCLPLIVVGTGMLYLGFWPMYRALLAQQWPTVPAHIDSAEVVTVRSAKGGTTYKLVAAYSYELNGQRYQSDVVSFYTWSDLFRSFSEERLRELDPFIRAASPFSARVNPADPHDAVLFPLVRWSFTGMFALCGVTMMTFCRKIFLAYTRKNKVR